MCLSRIKKKLRSASSSGILYRYTEPLNHSLYVLTCKTSFQYLSILGNVFIDCYNYIFGGTALYTNGSLGGVP